MKKYFACLVFIATLISCEQTEDVISDSLSNMDKMFINGFNLELEQVYLMNGDNVPQYLDTPKDSAFKNDVVKIGFNDFVCYNDTRDTILKFITKSEKWNVLKMETVYDTVYIEHGYGSSYSETMMISRSTYNRINCSNKYMDRSFMLNIKVADIYNYRGNDNHFFMVQSIKENIIYKSNLYFEVLTKNGYGLFNNDKYIYLDTNPIVTFSRQITAPLTSNQVKIEIEKGNYTLYLYNGLTTYKIGNNLYIPRYNSYVYIGTINTNGMVVNFESKYYRFKFKIVK